MLLSSRDVRALEARAFHSAISSHEKVSRPSILELLL